MWKNREEYEPDITIVTALFNGFQYPGSSR